MQSASIFLRKIDFSRGLLQKTGPCSTEYFDKGIAPNWSVDAWSLNNRWFSFAKKICHCSKVWGRRWISLYCCERSWMENEGHCRNIFFSMVSRGFLPRLEDLWRMERAAILSLLLDYSLLLHPAQIRVVESKLPAYTVGSLIEQSKVDAFLQFVRNVLESEEVEQHLSKFENAVKEIYKLRPSTKHMSGRTLEKMESTLPLARKWEKLMKVA